MKTETERMKVRVVQIAKTDRPHVNIADLLKRELNRIEKSWRAKLPPNQLAPN